MFYFQPGTLGKYFSNGLKNQLVYRSWLKPIPHVMLVVLVGAQRIHGTGVLYIYK